MSAFASKSGRAVHPQSPPSGAPPGGNTELASLFECPVCFDYVLPPILQCQSGHLVCANCRPKLTCCPTCRGPLGKSSWRRIVSYFEMTDFLTYLVHFYICLKYLHSKLFVTVLKMYRYWPISQNLTDTNTSAQKTYILGCFPYPCLSSLFKTHEYTLFSPPMVVESLVSSSIPYLKLKFMAFIFILAFLTQTFMSSCYSFFVDQKILSISLCSPSFLEIPLLGSVLLP